MPARPDLRQLAASLRESLDGLERDALVDILTHVLQEYVVEAPPPLAALGVERRQEQGDLTLAELVAALQARLDVPGLELLRVDGGEVHVHTAGGWMVLHPVQVGSADRPAGMPPSSPAGAPEPPAPALAGPARPGPAVQDAQPVAPMPRSAEQPQPSASDRKEDDASIRFSLLELD